MKEKTPLSQSCLLSDAWKIYFWSLKTKLIKSYFFLENYITSERTNSHNVLYDQQLSIPCYQVRFCANKYFE